MDLKALGIEIAKIGLPILGGAIGGPGGAAIATSLSANIGSKTSDPADIINTLRSSSDAVEKAKEFQATHRENLITLISTNDAKQVESVNQTMQEESKSGKPSSWREANGWVVAICTGTTILSTLMVFIYSVLTHDQEMLKTVLSQLPAFIGSVAMLLTISGAAVGITAWHHGMVDRLAAESE